jgi:hypothetical protein
MRQESIGISIQRKTMLTGKLLMTIAVISKGVFVIRAFLLKPKINLHLEKEECYE